MISKYLYLLNKIKELDLRILISPNYRTGAKVNPKNQDVDDAIQIFVVDFINQHN